MTGGRVTGGARVDGRRDLFEMTVRPESDDDVTITLPAGRDCATSGAICTKGENRRQLTQHADGDGRRSGGRRAGAEHAGGGRADDRRDAAGRGGC